MSTTPEHLNEHRNVDPAEIARFEAAEHGGELLYSYAGGVGTRSGEPADFKRLPVAGLYNASRIDREASLGFPSRNTKQCEHDRLQWLVTFTNADG